MMMVVVALGVFCEVYILFSTCSRVLFMASYFSYHVQMHTYICARQFGISVCAFSFIMEADVAGKSLKFIKS